MKTKLMAATAVAAAMTLLAPALALAYDDGSGKIDPRTWVYGPRNDDTTGCVIWNPVKQKLNNGQRFAARTVQGTFPATTDTTYCNAASDVIPNPTADMIDPDF